MADIPLRTYVEQLDNLIERKQVDEVVAHCRHILDLYPKHLDTYRMLGKALLEKGRHGDAADIFQRVLSVMPDDFISHVGMSIVREDEANLDAAIWHMERAFESSPANGAIQQELCRLYGRRDGVAPAKARLTRGALARMYAQGGLYLQAEAELKAALAAEVDRVDLLTKLADVYWQTDQPAQAAQTSAAILQKLPYSLEANRILVNVFRAQGRPNDASVYRQRLEALDPYEAFADPAVERYWMVPDGASPGDGGVDLYVGGAEHAVLHLLYARFWHKVLFDLGLVSTREPFRRLVNQGYILADAFTDARGMYVPAAEVERLADGSWARDGEPVSRRSGKMGKSLKNGVSPDRMYARYGADTLRLYEMAMGPLDADRPWHTDDVAGVHRFLQRLWRSLVDEQTGDLTVHDSPLREQTARLLNRTVLAVRDDFAALRFNVAIARLQELVTHASRLAVAQGAAPRALAEPLVLMVAPLAPHIAEELWARLGHRESVSRAPFPAADPALAAEPVVVLPVQVNGKVRFRIEVPPAASEEQVRQILTSDPEFARQVGEAAVERIIIVPGRAASVVTR